MNQLPGHPVLNVLVAPLHAQPQQLAAVGSQSSQTPTSIVQMQPGIPVSPMQGWQPGPPPWPSGTQFSVLSQPHPAGVQALPPSISMASTGDLAALAAAMRPFMSEDPVGSHRNDEELLIKALKKGHAQGLSPRQAIEKLHNVNHHSEIGWKNYLLDHLLRLYPKVYGREHGHNVMHQGTNSSLAIQSSGEKARRQPRNDLPSQTQRRDHDDGSSGSHQHAQSLVDTLTTQYDRQTVVERQKKHVTFSLNRKNEERRESGKRGVTKKLRPPKAAPPSLRSVKGIKKPKFRFSQDLQAASKSVVSSSESEDSRSYIDVDSASDSDQDNAPYQWRHGKLILPRKITEDDLRAMARFRFEHPPSADESSTGLAYWRRFASIPANAKRRSDQGWARASRTYCEVIEEYLEELMNGGSEEREREANVDSEPAPAVETPMVGTAAGVSRLPHDEVGAEHPERNAILDTPTIVPALRLPRKRAAEVGAEIQDLPRGKRSRVRRATEAGEAEKSGKAAKESGPVRVSIDACG